MKKYLLPLILILFLLFSMTAFGAVVFVDIREVTVNGATSITIQIPALASEGDLLIVYLAKDDNIAVYNTGDYSNWTMLYNIIDDSQTNLYLAWRIATAGDVGGSVSWTWNADSEDWIGVILAYSGVDTTTPIPFKGSDFLDSSDTPTAPSVGFTNLEAGSLVLQVFGTDFDDTPRTLPSELTSRFNLEQATDIGGAGGDRLCDGGWVSPIGFNDLESAWGNEERAYDEDTGTWTYCSGIPINSWGEYLELTIDAISCSKVRFLAHYIADSINKINIELYYDDGGGAAWQPLYEGIFADVTWVEKAIGSTQTVTAMRIKLYNDKDDTSISAELMEVDFYDITETGTAIFGIPSSNEWTAATLVIEAEAEVGEVPPQVTGVLATDGDYTDKVVIVWDAADRATKYYVWTGAEWVDVGDVQTYDYTGAAAPTITAGTASATDGSSVDYVTLSIAGESANNGSSVDYKVKAWNATGYGTDSAADAGYRGVGVLTFQWERSSADSDADYSEVDGATTDPYNDTGAPENGDGRYYKCVENATGAAEQTTNVDRGFRIEAPTYNYYGHFIK